jgi:hypothetical protein
MVRLLAVIAAIAAETGGSAQPCIPASRHSEWPLAARMQDHSNVNLVKDGSRRRSKRRRATSPPPELIGGVHRVADDSYADQDKGDKP